MAPPLDAVPANTVRKLSLDELDLQKKHLDALKSCPANSKVAFLQFLRFHANFTRTKTMDEAFAEMVKNFYEWSGILEEKNKQLDEAKKRGFRSPEAAPTEPTELDAIR